jgi:acyl transferase domain-containing protein
MPINSEQAFSNSIAIVGVGCRYPGAPSPEALWQLVRNGRDAVGAASSERLDALNHYGNALRDWPEVPSIRGGFLQQIDQFDHDFFRIPAHEAARMDPQQRLLLEVCWEALEDAGETASQLANQDVGVFVGVMNPEFHQLHAPTIDTFDGHLGVGSSLGIAANRLSYSYDLQGPSLAVDTLCSSSLVATHLACQSLLTNESNPIAIVGGVNVILTPAMTMFYLRSGLLSPDGHCKAFDAEANGLVRSEGCGVVILKKLSRALSDGNEIYAVIRGTAVNHNGRSNGVTAPNRWAQEAVLSKAYKQAGISPGQVQYVETQGTGTIFGDRIEATALSAVMSLDRKKGDRCKIGSIKTNIGHTESASGLAGLIKTALALKHREIPASLHFNSPNPFTNFDELSLQVQERLGSWDESRPLIAGVSAFGLGGTNAHIVLEQAPRQDAGLASVVAPTASAPYLLPLSARSPDALLALAKAVSALLSADKPSASLHDFCYTASTRRNHHEYRLAVVGNTFQEIATLLKTVPETASSSSIFTSKGAVRRAPKFAFVFSGDITLVNDNADAAPYERSSRLCEGFDGGLALFSKYVDEAENAAQKNNRALSDWYEKIELFALQSTLATLFQRWGIMPGAMIGEGFCYSAALLAAGICDVTAAVNLLFASDQLSTAEVSFDQSKEQVVPVFQMADGIENFVSSLAKNTQWTFIELSPSQSFFMNVQKCVNESAKLSPYVRIFEQDLVAREGVLHAVSELYALGADVAWRQIYTKGRCVSLPAYPWQRERCWLEPDGNRMPNDSADYVNDGNVRRSPKKMVPPDTELEKILAGIWRDVLCLKEVSADGNYFELGGTSLRALEIMNRVNKSLNVNIALRTLFAAPTIALQANHIENILIEEIDQMSDEEVELLLADSLEKE